MLHKKKENEKKDYEIKSDGSLRLYWQMHVKRTVIFPLDAGKCKRKSSKTYFSVHYLTSSWILTKLILLPKFLYTMYKIPVYIVHRFTFSLNDTPFHILKAKKKNFSISPKKKKKYKKADTHYFVGFSWEAFLPKLLLNGAEFTNYSLWQYLRQCCSWLLEIR